MALRRIEEEQINHERWLVSYADFITLLFAFFVVMYSISQVNEGKYRVLSNTLTEAFNVTAAELSLDPIQIGRLAKSNPINLIELKQHDALDPGAQAEQPAQIPDEFRAINQHLEDQLTELIGDESIVVRGNEEWLELELQSSLLFESGEAQIKEQARTLLADIAVSLIDQNNPIRVEGFTDNVPISTRRYPSNWELSSARALAVVKFLSEQGIAQSRLAAIGYGEFQPVADNATEEGRARNRRVVLMISKNAQLRPELTPLRSPALEPASAEPAAAPDPMRGIITVELEGGGLLFTSDPPAPATP